MDAKTTLYYARLKKIEFRNFRNIENGILEFPNSKPVDFLNGDPSIVGLYGQNGSGKTSVIMALGILKDVLSGKAITNKYKSCIKYGCDRCTLVFTFTMYNRLVDNNHDGLLDKDASTCYEVFYQFDITNSIPDDEDDEDEVSKTPLRIENESLKYRGITSSGKTMITKQTFIDTTGLDQGSKSNSLLFGSKDKENFFSQGNSEIVQKYRENRAITRAKAQSFIFSGKTIKMIENALNHNFFSDERASKTFQSFYDSIVSANTENDLIQNITEAFSQDEAEILGAYFYCSTPFYLVNNLRIFGVNYLHVIDTATTGITNINTQLPLLLWSSVPGKGVFNYQISLQMDDLSSVPEKNYKFVRVSLEAVSNVLQKIVPGISLSLVDYGIKLTAENVETHYFEIVSNRGETTIPIKFESDGIRRIVSILSLLIAAYNDESFTVAIDEIDSGIFEFLLGEILAVMSESIKGQLVFTSHNLRPLEVLPSKFLFFTTTDPAKRFTSIPSRGNSNLRDTYFRNIVLGSDKESIYNPTDRYEIALAFYQAGHLGDKLYE